jgi:hypothetical protein
LFSHESAVQALPSSQTSGDSLVKMPQAARARQPSLTEQYCVASHFVSSGTNMHWFEKHVFVVQAMPSSQSASSQHSAQSPPQHFSVPKHLGEALQVPSALQRSMVQLSLSLQSSGPPHAVPVPAPVPIVPAPASFALPPLAEPPALESAA